MDDSAVTSGSLLDTNRFARKAYGLERPAFVLVRPDGYVAFRGAATEAAQLRDYCRRHFAPKLQSKRFVPLARGGREQQLRTFPDKFRR